MFEHPTGIQIHLTEGISVAEDEIVFKEVNAFHLRRKIAICIEPVSYTHLDVYKRQEE